MIAQGEFWKLLNAKTNERAFMERKLEVMEQTIYNYLFPKM